MCGFVAVFQRDGSPVRTDELIAMRDSLTHRGPDDSGLFVDGPAGLGFRRLRIIDLAGGHQPMPNEAGTVHVVFNGEIYNYRELRQLLTSKGVRLRTQSDTETILGLYDLFGEACVDHLRGMFAFVLWDGARRKLVAARDRMGIKPLYVLRTAKTVAFVSEIKALLHLGSWTPRFADEHLAEYLVYRNLAGRRTMFHGVERLLPGELMVVTERSEQRRQYWTPPLPVSADAGGRSVEDWRAELDDLLRQVVRGHMISDVPLGTFNSGGVDSSLVTAMAAEVADERLNTYSVGFDEAAFDERPYADIVAQRFGTTHHSVVLGGDQYAEMLPTAIWHHDEPLNHPHSVHLLHLSRVAREKVTVVLTGEGSDELFAGYPRYRLPRLLDHHRWLATRIGSVAALAGRLVSQRERLRLRAVLNGGTPNLDALSAFVAPSMVERLATGSTLPEPRLDGARPSAGQHLAHALRLDQLTYLQSLCNRLDKMNMAASLEGRVPFLDHLMVEFAARVPPGLKLRGLETKFLLKTVARRYLPDAIVGRRKAGFAVPVSGWLAPGGPLAKYLDMLSEPRTAGRGWVDGTELDRIVREHRSRSADHGELLWALVNLELWHRLMIDDAQQVRRTGAVAARATGA